MRAWAFTGIALPLLLSLLLGSSSAEQCGRQAGGAKCSGGLCCSQYGWCGDTAEYCTDGCQSQCGGGGGGGGDLGSIISRATFEEMLKHRNDNACPGKGFYTYDAFIAAAKAFPGNYNYGQCARAIRADLLNNPDLVAADAVISFKTAIWFWMTPQSPKPSCHDVITGRWSPSGGDSAAGRVPGYGVVTNIINGGLECGRGRNAQVEDRIGFFKRYCDLLGVSYGSNLDCYNQKPFGNGLYSFVDAM
ncbi:hypothetical protein Tsubulata_045136 [Turnera subulata]|uniref:Chitin-binding type-1 domain-containing protein n=1 Tax=Turnera subulata TaxID=218843 RepID=A0A9Q0F4E1_9ROSI|nr:hypothetical protein Tsubulata_045136 [Turnera subulata]